MDANGFGGVNTFYVQSSKLDIGDCLCNPSAALCNGVLQKPSQVIKQLAVQLYYVHSTAVAKASHEANTIMVGHKCHLLQMGMELHEIGQPESKIPTNGLCKPDPQKHTEPPLFAQAYFAEHTL
ncbi:hypothetical protein STEG23_037932, partial [Scotinomys teguina]